MPTAGTQSIDWSGIRAAALVIGVREAARQAGADLPLDEQNRFVERVMKRSSREGWLDVLQLPAKQGNGPPAKPTSAQVRNGSDSLANVLRADSDATKTALSRATRKGAEHLSAASPQRVIKSSRALKDLAGVGSVVHGWENEQAGSGTFGGLRVHSRQTIINVDQRKVSE